MVTKKNKISGSSIGGVRRKTHAGTVVDLDGMSKQTTTEAERHASKQFETLVVNELEPNSAFIMPRAVPTTAGCIHQHCELSKGFDLNVNRFGAAIARPSVYNTLQLCESESVAVSASFSANMGDDTDDSLTTYIQAGNYALAPNLTTDDGNTIYPVPVSDTTFPYPYISSLVGGLSGNELSFPGGSLPPAHQLWGYEGDMATAASFLTMTAAIRGGHTQSASLFVFAQTTGGTWNLLNSSPSVNLTNEVTATFAIPAISSGGYARTVFILQFGTVSLRALQKLEVTSIPDALTLVAGERYIWKTYSLWDLLGSERHGASILQQQFDTSQRFCVSGFSFLAQNTTAEIYKGGSIAACQLPGDSIDDVPSSPEDIKQFVSSRNDGKVYTGLLKNGSHYSYIPEKIQDLFYRTTEGSSDLANFHEPFCVMAWEGAPIEGSNVLSMLFTVKINIEVLTTDISVTKFLPSTDWCDLAELIVRLMQQFNPCSENPKHMQKVMNIAKKVVTHPMFKDTVKKVLRLGLEAAPALLALA